MDNSYFTTKICTLSIWLKLLGILMERSIQQGIQPIRYRICKIVLVDDTFLTCSFHCVGKLLVELDIKGGLSA